MSELPRNLDETLTQCANALARATAAGKLRAQIEIKVPGLDLLTLLTGLADKPPLAEGGWAAAFPDAGAAALARKKVGQVNYTLRGLSELRGGIEQLTALVLLEPSAVEVDTVEALANRIGERPFILLNSRLQEAGVVGIGLAGRQLRDRFLSTVEPVYAIVPFDGGTIYRCWPGNWEIWREEPGGDYTRVAELGKRPTGEEIDRAMAPAKGEGLLAGLRRFLRALGQ